MDKVTAFAGAVGRRVLNLFVLKSHEFGGSWGGTECAAYLPLRTHLLEASFFCWTLAAIFAVFRLGHRFSDHYMIVKINMMSMQYRSHWLERTVDKTLSATLLGMYLMLIYYKFNCSSLVSLSQPCHVIMLLEGLALASDGPAGTVITTYLLPALSGTFLALLFPDTTGLDQPFEELSYWVQHYLIIVVPVYLLTRRNGLALDLSSRDTVAFGLWLLTFVHYTFYESMDLLLQVPRDTHTRPLFSFLVVFDNRHARALRKTGQCGIHAVPDGPHAHHLRPPPVLRHVAQLPDAHLCRRRHPRTDHRLHLHGFGASRHGRERGLLPACRHRPRSQRA